MADGNLKSNVKFADLHPSQALPWQELVCTLSTLDTKGLIKRFGLDKDYLIASVTLPDLKNEPDWMEVGFNENSTQKNELRFGGGTAKFSKANDDSVPSFKPKFRIVAAANDQF